MNSQTTKLARLTKPNPLAIEVWTRYVTSDTSVRKLAREYDKGATTIHRIIALVDEWARRDTRQVSMRIKWQQTRALWRQIAELEALYEKSKEAEIEKREERDITGLLTGTVEIRRERIGDALRCLEAIRKAMADIRKIWGADAPKYAEVHVDGQIDVATMAATAAMETDEGLRMLLEAGDRWLRGETISQN